MKFICGMFVFGFYIPFIIQIFAQNITLIYACNIIMLLGTIPIFLNEMCQIIEDSIFTYLQSFWNINDMTMLVLTWIYIYLRLTNESYNGSFLIINDGEYTDIHVETELLVEMLEKESN